MINSMASIQISKSDVVLSLVSHIFPLETSSATVVEDAMSSLTLEDDSTISGVNTISTYLGTPHGRIGGSEIEKAEVQQWLSVSATPSDDDDTRRLLDLNTHIAQQTFLVGNDWTVSDIVLYARLHDTVTRWNARKQSEYCHITRWFNHIQNLDPVSSFTTSLPTLELTQQFDKSVTVALKKGAPKESVPKDANKSNPAQPATTTTTTTSTSGPTSVAGKKDKKDKKVKEAKPAAAEVELSPSMISFKVGVIQKAILHPDADSLYVSTVDLGESEPRTVVSGLVKYIPLSDMQNRKVVCVCNLKPAAMRGIKSSAMVLAASPAGLGEGQVKDMVELVQPPESAKPGDVLHFSGFEGTPEPQLNPKKKIFETIQVGFTTTDALDVVYRDIKAGSTKTGKLITSNGHACTVKSLIGASIR